MEPTVRFVRLAPWLVLLVLLSGCASALQAPASGSVAVDRPDGTAVMLDAQTLAGLARETFTATDHDTSARFAGIDVVRVLQAAGVEPPQSLRGVALRRVLLVRAADGYAAASAFAELDPTIGGKRAYLVDRADEAVLPAGAGPWRIVVPGEGRPTRWVRQVTRLAVIDLN